ncbi:hypothetical protein EON66_07590 [archaeon]|nr:MAG: hypothetical protein EON66_07590 [archaeon]
MVVYNFKKLQPVPSHKEFVDIVLTRTQRKTPSTVHSGFHIARIREFYMRKVRFTQQTFHDKLSLIVDEFPKLDVRAHVLASRAPPLRALPALTSRLAPAPLLVNTRLLLPVNARTCRTFTPSTRI